MSEFGEPWKLTDECLVTRHGLPAGCIDGPVIERIQACINACSGIPTDDLVSGKVRVVREGPDWSGLWTPHQSGSTSDHPHSRPNPQSP